VVLRSSTNSPKDYYDLISGSDQAGQKQPYKATTLVTELASRWHQPGRHTWKGLPRRAIPARTSTTTRSRTTPSSPSLTSPRNPAQCANVVPYTQTQLSTDLNSTSPPDFVWITPNECSDMHAATALPKQTKVAQADQWLQKQLPIVLSSPWYASGGSSSSRGMKSVIKDTSGGSEERRPHRDAGDQCEVDRLITSPGGPLRDAAGVSKRPMEWGCWATHPIPRLAISSPHLVAGARRPARSAGR